MQAHGRRPDKGYGFSLPLPDPALPRGRRQPRPAGPGPCWHRPGPIGAGAQAGPRATGRLCSQALQGGPSSGRPASAVFAAQGRRRRPRHVTSGSISARLLAQCCSAMWRHLARRLHAAVHGRKRRNSQRARWRRTAPRRRRRTPAQVLQVSRPCPPRFAPQRARRAWDACWTLRPCRASAAQGVRASASKRPWRPATSSARPRATSRS